MSESVCLFVVYVAYKDCESVLLYCEGVLYLE